MNFIQEQVETWARECFGLAEAYNITTRMYRFLEEAIELVQACGGTADDAHQLVDYVFGRPIGEQHQEVGGTMVTLAALCTAINLDMMVEGQREINRVNQPEVIAKIRRKNATKPQFSPLPGVA